MLDHKKNAIQHYAYLSSLSILALKSLIRDLTAQLLGSHSNADGDETCHWAAVTSDFRPKDVLLSSATSISGLVAGLIRGLEFAKKATLSSSSTTTTCSISYVVIVLR